VIHITTHCTKLLITIASSARAAELSTSVKEDVKHTIFVYPPDQNLSTDKMILRMINELVRLPDAQEMVEISWL
jgi:hypothetical protein